MEEQEDHVHIQSNESGLFQGDFGAVLLLLDRMEDPAIPLLSQWTYQAMVYELLALQNLGTKLSFTKNTLEFLEEVYVMINPFKPWQLRLASDYVVNGLLRLLLYLRGLA